LPSTWGANVDSISVSGSDVYVSGCITINSDLGPTVPGYWKNGTWVTLPYTTTGEANSLLVSGTDVYAGGCNRLYNKTTGIGYLYAGYWKNGIWSALPQLSAPLAAVSSIFVYGTDVYCGGYIEGSNNVAIPGYWKNSTWNALPVPSNWNGYASRVNCLFVQ
jgi:hypothetical protein